MNKIEVIMHCKTGKGSYITVFEEETPQKWYANEARKIEKPKSGLWQKIRSAFELPTEQQAPKRTTEHISGTFYMGKMRCPYCGNENFIKCRKCGEMTCSPRGATEFKCQSCGNAGKISGTISKVSASKSESANGVNRKTTTPPSDNANKPKPPKAPWQQG